MINSNVSKEPMTFFIMLLWQHSHYKNKLVTINTVYENIDSDYERNLPAGNFSIRRIVKLIALVENTWLNWATFRLIIKESYKALQNKKEIPNVIRNYNR